MRRAGDNARRAEQAQQEQEGAVKCSKKPNLRLDSHILQQNTRFANPHIRAEMATEIEKARRMQHVAGEQYEYILVLQPDSAYERAAHKIDFNLVGLEPVALTPSYTLTSSSTRSSDSTTSSAWSVGCSASSCQHKHAGQVDMNQGRQQEVVLQSGIFVGDGASSAASEVKVPRQQPQQQELQRKGSLPFAYPNLGRRRESSVFRCLAANLRTHQRHDVDPKELQERLQHFTEQLSTGVMVRLHRSDRKAEQVRIKARPSQGRSGYLTISWNVPTSSEPDASFSPSWRGGMNAIWKGGNFTENASRLKSAGSFSSGAITNVFKADDADPEHPGFFGSPNLRASGDFYEKNRTICISFSEQELSESRLYLNSFDIECESDDEFAMLFYGFNLILLLHCYNTQTGAFDIESPAAKNSLKCMSPRGTPTGKEHSKERQQMSENAGYTSALASNPEYFIGERSNGAKLTDAGLEVKRLYHMDTKRIMLRIRLPEVNMEGERMPFRSSESQRRIDRIIRSRKEDGGADLGELSYYGRLAIKKRIPLHDSVTLDILERVLPRLPIIGKQTNPLQPPNMSSSQRSTDFKDGTKNLLGLGEMPLELVAEYFGESIALYFAWMHFYSRFLLIPSGVGAVCFVVQLCRPSDKVLQWIRLLYSVVIMIWASFFAVCWRRRCSELLYQWGTLEVHTYGRGDQTRPQFRGVKKWDRAGGSEWLVYPKRKRAMTLVFTVSAVLLLMGLVGAGLVSLLQSKDVAKKNIGETPGNAVIILGTSFFVPVSYMIFRTFSGWLNDWENYRTDSQNRNALVVKLFSFRFICVFTPMYFFAFFASGDSDVKMRELRNALLSFMTFGQYWYMFCMTFVPYGYQYFYKLPRLKEKLRKARNQLEEKIGECASPAQTFARRLQDEAESPLWLEQDLHEYDADDDYSMSVLQFGYVTLFSVALPLAPLVALINNSVQTRVDAFKLCRTRRRPIARKTHGIGVWDNVLDVMTSISIVTNCALVGFTWSNMPDMSWSTKILIFLGCEHVLFFIKYCAQSLTPRVPGKVARALRRDHGAAKAQAA